jgi:hypothetical protein
VKACPRCNGPLFKEADDIVCISCGWRSVDEAKPMAGNGSGSIDPFDAALAALVKAADAIEKQITRYARGLTQRRDQARRLGRALAILNGPSKRGGTGRCANCQQGYRSQTHREQCIDQREKAAV